MDLKLKTSVMCGVAVCLSLVLASPVRGEVFAVPNSDDVVLGSVVLKDGVTATFRAREGTMVTVKEKGVFWGFIPQILDKSNQKINIIPFRITGLMEGKQRADEILGQSNSVKAGASSVVKLGEFSLKINFDNISVGQFRYPAPEDPDSMAPKELQLLYGEFGGDFCCLTCSGVTVCANGVSMGCGSCFAGGGGGRLPV